MERYHTDRTPPKHEKLWFIAIVVLLLYVEVWTDIISRDDAKPFVYVLLIATFVAYVSDTYFPPRKKSRRELAEERYNRPSYNRPS